MEESGHYYSVYLTSLAVGFPEEIAFKLAVYTQLPDEVKILDATWLALNVFPSWIPGKDYSLVELLQKVLHQLSGNDSVKETSSTLNKIKNHKGVNLIELGLLLHQLGDDFGHRVIRNESRLYGEHALIGHVCDWHDPDHEWLRPFLFNSYLSTLYLSLLNIRKRTNSDEKIKLERLKLIRLISDRVKTFNSANSKMRLSTKGDFINVIDSRDTIKFAYLFRNISVCHMNINMRTYKPENYTSGLLSITNLDEYLTEINKYLGDEQLSKQSLFESIKSAILNFDIFNDSQKEYISGSLKELFDTGSISGYQDSKFYSGTFGYPIQ